MNNKIVNGQKLLALFLAEIKKSKSFQFLEGTQPFKIKYNLTDFYVYIKNITSAYFKDRPDVTRAQLPILPIFDSIKKSSIPFIFLGYDAQNDVYVCWNFNIVKKRLNEAKSVSLYSRLSEQCSVKDNIFKTLNLKNDDKVILFKRNMIVDFFENINTFFLDSRKQNCLVNSENMSSKKNCEEDKERKLTKITEPELLLILRKLLTGPIIHTLEAIELVQQKYKEMYPDMSYREWSDLIKNIRFSNRQDNFKNEIKFKNTKLEKRQ